MPPRPASIKVRALQWLAQREHSHVELRDKLMRLLAHQTSPASPAPGHDQPDREGSDAPDPSTEVDALLQWLEARGYLSQARFTESRIHARQARFGNLRIRHELQQHGIRLDDQTKQTLQQTELQRAQEVWRKKYGQPATDATGRVRQMRFLAGRGFSIDVVRRVVAGAGHPDDDDSDAASA